MVHGRVGNLCGSGSCVKAVRKSGLCESGLCENGPCKIGPCDSGQCN